METTTFASSTLPHPPILALCSGSSKKAVEQALLAFQPKHAPKFLEILKDQGNYEEGDSTPTNRFRGYAILQGAGEETNHREICIVEEEEKKPRIWFIFPGSTTTLPGSTKELMHLQPFSDSIKASSQVLAKHCGFEGPSLLELVLLGEGGSTFTNVLNSQVTITAVQLALCDLLESLHIVPDGMMGFSLGELACSYADKGTTAEQTIFASHARGRAILEANLPPGAMLYVALPWEGEGGLRDRCPQDIDLSCVPQKGTSTLSGPAESIEKFRGMLQAENVHMTMLNSCGQAFHSRYVAPAAPSYKKALEAIIPNPKPRSARWFSSSEALWGCTSFSSAEYHTNNFVSMVRGADTIAHIPKGALVIEISPSSGHGGLIKRTVEAAEYVGLTISNSTTTPTPLKKDREVLTVFLRGLGKIYLAGVDLKDVNGEAKYTVASNKSEK